ncbi:MAG: hypothetical protein JSS94_00025 [Bacteroidetes bacterium]|nr:hypothetical protein [Bacteroidota bacterium]
MNYFELFGFEVFPRISQSLLSKKYISLQRESHPDFFTRETGSEQDEALDKSADINKAYKIFKNPDDTLAYFLQVKGIIVPGEKFELPSDFLMEMMDLNESISDSPENGKKAAAAFQVGLGEEMEYNIASLSQDGENLSVLEELKSLYYRKKYLNRILDRLAD